MWLNKVHILEKSDRNMRPSCHSHKHLLNPLNMLTNQKAEEWRGECVLAASEAIVSERRKGGLQMSEHLTASSQLPDPSVTCYRWGSVVVGRTSTFEDGIKTFPGGLVCLLKHRDVHPGARPALIAFLLSVHLILDPLQHRLHPPQLWAEGRQ